MKKYLLLSFFLLLFLVAGSAQAQNTGGKPPAGQPRKHEAPLEATIQRTYDDQGREIFTVVFNYPIMWDKEDLFKSLSEGDRPFRTSVDIPTMKVFWLTESELRIEPGLSPDDWEALLEKAPLTIFWKKILSRDQRPLQFIDGQTWGGRNPLYVNPVSLEGEDLVTEIGLIPFQVWVSNRSEGAGTPVVLALTFNRFMVAQDQVGLALAAADVPLNLSPEIPKLNAQWQNRRTLVLKSPLTQAEFWEHISDRPFKLAWKPGFSNFLGLTAPNLQQARFEGFGETATAAAFYVDRFALVNLEQTAMDIEGWATFDLTFNKPVKMDDVKNHLRIQKYVTDVIRPQPVSAQPEFLSLTGDGTTATFRVRGLLGQKIAVSLQGLRSADGRGGLDQPQFHDSTVQHFFTVAGSSLEIEEQYPWKPYVTINVREELQFDGAEKYIKLDPPLDFTLSPYGREGNSLQIFADFTAEPTTITLLKGMPSRRGVLTEDAKFTVKLPPNLDPQLIFTGRGRYLSPEKPLLVKLAGRNVEKLRLQAWRVHDNNLPAIINIQDYDSGARAKLTLQFSKNMVNRITESKAEAGTVFERLLDLGQILAEKPHGAYLLRLSRVNTDERGRIVEEDEAYDYLDYRGHTERYLPVMISDISLSAHVLPGRVMVWANSLSQAKALGSGTVKVYDSANQVLAQGQTDRDGFFSAELDVASAVFLTVEKDGDLNYLLLGERRSSYAGDDYDRYYEDFREDRDAKWYGGRAGYLNVEAPKSQGAMREYLNRGYEAFLFMPRDMFKPGETVPFKAMLRDKDLLPPRETFPLLWRVYDPDGRAHSQGRVQLNEFGGLDFAAEIPFSARTGSWSAALYLPESENELGRVKFTVEDFVPPRLALELAADQPVYQGENPEMTIEADVRYLFGAPGANLAWEMDAVIASAAFRPQGWAGFDFTGPSTDFSATTQRRAARGTLDENGHAEIKYMPNLETKRLPTKMSVEFVVSAQEDGGRWNAKRLGVEYFARDLILGYQAPEDTAVKTPFTFQVAAVTPEGRPAEIGQLNIRVSQILTQYYNSYRYGRLYRETVEDFKLKQEGPATLAEGRGAVAFTPETAGEYLIEIEDPASGLAIQRRISVYGLETAESDLPRGVVELSFDRESYRPGEKATVKVKSPFPGRLWLTVENDALLHSDVVEMKSTEAEVRIPVSEKIKTNAVVTATVVRPLAEGETGYRAIGVKSLEIDREIYRLNVVTELAGRLNPSAPNTLTIKITDAKGRPVSGEATVALVDEGVLSLSGFKTPSPLELFTAGRRMLTLFYDLYEQLLPVEKVAVPFLIPGGGDGLGRSGLFSPFKRKQEILSIFLPSVPINSSGEAVVELNVPEYSGQGRLMVVAGSRSGFGAASQKVTISRDLTVEPTLPLALAPGDSFEIPIRVFVAAEAPEAAGRGASIKLGTSGPLRLEETAAEFQLSPGAGETRVFKAVAQPAAEGGETTGIGRLTIESRSGSGESFSQSVEVAVRPPYPRVVESSSLETRAAETSIAIPNEKYLKGTVEALVTLAKSPAAEAARAVGYLREYPYGCLEQTVSQAWIYVAAGDLLAGLTPDQSRGDHINQGLNTAVKRLLTMQTGDGGFASWPGGRTVYEWGSVYAVHFLTEAAKKTELPPGLLERSLNWMRAYLSGNYSTSNSDPQYILATRAYAVYVLAKNGEYRQSWVNYLKDRYEGLSPSARIFLAGAEALEAGNSTPLAVLEKPADWSLNTLRQRVSSLESSPRNRALRLLVWTEVDPLSPTAKGLAEQVADDGRSGHWSNTQENGLAAFALGTYLSKSDVGKPYRATLTGANGEKLFEAGPNDVVTAKVSNGPLKLNLSGEGRPYYSLTVGGVPLTAPAPKAEGLELARTWIMEDGRQAPISTAADGQNIISVARGDRVIVELTVKAGEPLQNMVLVDLTPGGFEIENPRLISPAAGDKGNGLAEKSEPVSETRLELREDRLVVIEPWLNGGATYRYTLRAVTPGEYTLPPTIAEGMYEPQRQAILSGGRVRVTDR